MKCVLCNHLIKIEWLLDIIINHNASVGVKCYIWNLNQQCCIIYILFYFISFFQKVYFYIYIKDKVKDKMNNNFPSPTEIVELTPLDKELLFELVGSSNSGASLNKAILRFNFDSIIFKLFSTSLVAIILQFSKFITSPLFGSLCSKI